MGIRWLTTALIFPLAPLTLGQNSQFVFDPPGNLVAQASETLALPQILGQPQMQVVIPGESASFSVVVADMRGISYQWYFSNSPIVAATSDTLLITNVSTSNQGFYWVAVSNSFGSIGSALANLYIDSRGCSMPDSWQLQYFGNLNQNSLGDYDGAGDSNLQDFLNGTNPTNAATALYQITLLNDGGMVVISPNQSAYTSGQMVTLTATGSSSAPFHAWTGDAVTRSNSITVTMTNNLSLFARFLPFTLIWTNTASGDWNVAANWSPNLSPGSNESVVIATYATVTENSNVDLVDFALGNGISAPQLTGSGRVTISGTGNWYTGTMSGNGTTVVKPAASLAMANSSTLFLANNRTLENAGSVVWVGGNFSLSGVLTNDPGGQIQFLNSASVNYGGGTARFDNAGTFTMANNASTFMGMEFNDYGTVNFPGGTLTLDGGGILASSLTVPAGSAIIFQSGIFTSTSNLSLTGPGTLIVNGGIATLAGTVNVSGSNIFGPAGSVDFTGNYTCTNNSLLISGSASFDGTGVVSPAIINFSSGTLGGAQNVTALSAMSWTGGAMTGTGRTIIPPGVTLTINNPSSFISITSRTLDNGGTTTWSGQGLTINGGVITNEPGALFQVQNPASMNFGGGVPRFDNAGTFRTAGAGTTTFASVNFNNYGDTQIQSGTLQLDGGLNNGTMEVPVGTTLNLGSGTFTSGAGSSIAGAGNFTVSGAAATLSGLVNLGGTNTFSNGTAELNGNYICTNNTMIISGGTANFDGTGTVAPTTLTLSSGALGGSNVVTVGSTMTWMGGSLNGTGRTVIPPAATLNIAGASTLLITSHTLDNGGTALWSGGNMEMNAGVITNEPGALFQMQSPGYIGFGGGAPRFDNAGTFRSTGAGTNAFASVNFNNYNDTQIQGGTLQLGGGLNSGTMKVPVGTTLNLGGTFTSSAGSSITGAGNLTVSFAAATLSGLVNLSGTNTFTGNGTAELNGNYICTNNTMVISGVTADFDGTGTVAPSTLTLSNGALGGSNVVTVSRSMSWTSGSMSGTGRTVIPPGATLTIANPSILTINNRTLDNGGTTVWTGAGNINLNAAVISNRVGALFNPQNSSPIFFGGGSPRFDNAGTFRKSVSTGTTTIGGSVPFTNYGTVDIQSGILAMGGGYASASNSLLNCGIGGKTPGTNYGQLQVSGTAVLNGNLSVNLTNGYIPAANNSFTLLTAGARSNTFANFTYPSNIVTMQLSNTATSVIAQVTGVASVPQPVLMQPVISASNILLTWTANSNLIYRLEYNPALAPSNWNAVPGDVTTSSNTASKLDSLTSSNRYYRVQVLP